MGKHQAELSQKYLPCSLLPWGPGRHLLPVSTMLSGDRCSQPHGCRQYQTLPLPAGSNQEPPLAAGCNSQTPALAGICCSLGKW